MIPDRIHQLISRQKGHYRREPEERELVRQQLLLLAVHEKSEFGEFFLAYCLTGVLSEQLTQLNDLCSPSPQILHGTEFVREVYEADNDFIALSTWEGEGGILYSKSSGRIFDVDASQLDDLNNARVQPRWNGFFELMEWYLGEREEEIHEN